MKLRRIVGAVVFGISAGPAFAGTVDCTNYLGSFTTSTGTTATSCAGFFDGNVLDNSSTSQNPDVQTQTSALASLGFTFTDFNDYTKVDLASDATVLSFGMPLYGDTIIGIHFGNSSAVGNSTGFFEFNFTQPTSSINLGISAPSDAVLYTTASAPVPEPATWALMLLGFAGIGFALRRTRTRRPARLLQIA